MIFNGCSFYSLQMINNKKHIHSLKKQKTYSYLHDNLHLKKNKITMIYHHFKYPQKKVYYIKIEQHFLFYFVFTMLFLYVL